jgi:hypothetical protein
MRFLSLLKRKKMFPSLKKKIRKKLFSYLFEDGNNFEQIKNALRIITSFDLSDRQVRDLSRILTYYQWKALNRKKDRDIKTAIAIKQEVDNMNLVIGGKSVVWLGTQPFMLTNRIKTVHAEEHDSKVVKLNKMAKHESDPSTDAGTMYFHGSLSHER